MSRLKFPHTKRLRTLFLIGGLVVIVLLVLAGLQLLRPHDSKQTMEEVRDKVGRLILLPTDEEPSLATVSDTAKLTDDFLKANARNGDKVLIYPKAKKVVLYRPSIDRVVAMGPLMIEASAQQVQGSRIAVWSGNGVPGSTQAIEAMLRSEYPSAKIGAVQVAKRQDYPTTIVIDLTDGDKYDLVTNLMQKLQAERGVLPQGEARPDNIDILIITGVDR